MDKKSIMAATIILAMATSAAARPINMTNMQIGYSSNKQQANSISDSKETGGGYLAYDIMSTGQDSGGLGLGFQFDINSWEQSGENSRYGAYSMGATLKAGYTFEDGYGVPLKIKTGIGYGVVDMGTESEWGPQYEAGAEYSFVKGKFGIGAKIKRVEAKILGEKIEVDSSIGYLTFGF